MAQGDFEVAELCGTLDVSRSSYYSWQDNAPSRYKQQSQELGPMIKDIFLQHKRRYGARRISFELKEQGVSCSRGKARKIMGQMGLVAIQPKSFKPRTTESRHTLGYSPNLLIEGVDLDCINQVWVGDITYIAMQNQFAYLALLMDLFSRKIVGWGLDLNMEASLVTAALKQAIRSRQPCPGLIHHTDRGGQYAATEYRQLLARANMNQSMSRAGDCYDNAFMESCFGTIKTELEMTTYQSLKQARQEIQDYINYYNNIRRHSSIDYLSPNRFEITRSP
jgi:putative transposase